MKIWQKISIALIVLALCVGVLSFYQPGGGWMQPKAYSAVVGYSPLVPVPNVSWNSRVAWFFGGPQPNVSWNSRVAWIFTGPQPNVSWNS